VLTEGEERNFLWDQRIMSDLHACVALKLATNTDFTEALL
jgi:hypothetical protein